VALLCLSALALDNGITIHEAGGAGQTARPMTVYRSFAQGEFASGTYPKPRIGGSVAPAWQVDVKTRWPDGSVQMAYVSFRINLTATGSAAVDFVGDSNPCHLGNLATCQAAALSQVQMHDYDTGGGTGSWSATWHGTVNSIGYSAAARAMINAGAWRWSLRGPVVSGIIVEDRSTALAYDFGWTYDSGTTAWIAPTSDAYKSLHPVFEIRFYPDPDGAGSLTAWGGVEVDAQLWNVSTLRLQKFNPIDLALKTGIGEADTAYSVTGKSFHARSRRHKLAWSGTAPGAVVVDYNFQYLIHTKLIGPYDYSLAVAGTLADNGLNDYNTNLGSDEPQWCGNSAFCANWRKAVGTTGARGEIALVARWYLNYLYLMGHSGTTTAKKKEIWDKLVLGNADAGGHAPVHYMETATNLTFYSPQDSTNAFGKVGSINARTNGWTAGGFSESTYMPPVCSADPCDGRAANGTNSTGGWIAYGSTNYNSHAPSFYSIPAFLTGYHYYLTGTQFEAAYMLATENACTSGSSCRHNPHGIFFYDSALRETAWAMRNITWATILTPDGEIEKAYFKAKLINNAKFTEGVMLLTTGVHAPADTSCPTYVRSDGTVLLPGYDLWCAGRYWWTDGPGIPASNPLRLTSYGYTAASTTDGWHNAARHTTGFWQSYLGAAWGWVASTGAILDSDNQPVFKHIRDAQAAHFAGRVLSNPKSMYLLRDIEWSIGPSTGGICTTFADCSGAYVTDHTLGADMTDSQTTLVINSTEIRSTGDNWLNMSWMKADDEYVRLSGAYTNNSPSAGKATITIAARGQWGSTPAAHTSGAAVTWLPGPWVTYSSEYNGGYPVLARAALALLYDAKQVGQYSPTSAYYVFQGSLPYQNYSGNPLWAFVPRETVSSVQASGESGGVTLRWSAPSAAACRVHLGTAPPTTSSDSGDNPATAPGPAQRYQASGLNAGVYHYRISCGTARASGTVTVTP
jgi:hypothetical protein